MTVSSCKCWAAKLCLAVSLLCGPWLAVAQLAVPPLAGHVTDQTGTLTTEQRNALEQALTAFEARKGSQLAVLMVATTAPETIEQYALRVAEAWKLGRRKIDDGAILVVALKDRSLRIEVGYGLEGALSDAISKRIIDEAIVPRFKAQDIHGGVKAGIDQMMAVVDGEPLPQPAATNQAQREDDQAYVPILFVVAIVVGRVLRAAIGRLPAALVTGGAVAVVAWFIAGTLAFALFAGMVALFITLLGVGFGGRGVGTYYGGDGGRGGSGGFSGGGGGFGGGGASGRW